MQIRNRSRSRQRSRSRSRSMSRSISRTRKSHKPAKYLTFTEKTEIIREIEGKKSFENLVSKNLNENWDGFGWLLSNPNISRNFIEEHSDLPWDWIYIFRNKQLDINFINKYKNRIPLNHHESLKKILGNCISENQTLTMDFVETHIELPWNWQKLSRNPALTMDFVERHSRLPWDWEIMSDNPALTMDFVERHIGFNWDWQEMSDNPALTMDFVERHIRFNWDWRKMSDNPALTMDFVERHIGLPWSWKKMSENLALTMDFVERHIGLNWYFREISKNPALTMDFVERHIGLNWDWERLSENTSLTMDFVAIHPEFLVWNKISKNPALTMEFLEATLNNPSFHWNWNKISRNPALTEEFIREHPDFPWNWEEILFNAQISLDFVLENREIFGDKLKFMLTNPWIWYSYVTSDYDELPIDIDSFSLSFAQGLYSDRVFNFVYLNEMRYRESEELLEDLIGRDVTENVVGKYITGRRMYV